MSSYSFRWGIPALDDGFVQVPNFVLRNAVAAGATQTELLLIICLASYKPEHSGGASYPSLGTIADSLGSTRRSVRRAVSSLKTKGLLIVTERTGATSLYNFRPLVYRCMELAEHHRTETSYPSDESVAKTDAEADKNGHVPEMSYPTSEIVANLTDTLDNSVRPRTKTSEGGRTKMSEGVGQKRPTKIELKREDENREEEDIRPGVKAVKLWESETASPVSPSIMMAIYDFIDEGGASEEMVIDAIKETRAHIDPGKPVTWAYTRTVLNNWIANGGKPDAKQRGVKGARNAATRRYTRRGRSTNQGGPTYQQPAGTYD